MQPRDPERTVRLSVLDRLLGDDDDGGPGTPWARSVTRLKAALLRDLEWLLNTRRTIEPAGDSYPLAQASVLHYGLPDLTSLAAGSHEVRNEVLRHVEEAIQRFEPRLSRVRVVSVEDAPGGGRELRFAVEGLLQMEPEPQRVTFDTVLEVASGAFQVSGGTRA
ncbi:MAG TPA: type VI secretion system baseplate subunit TssE [Longimicrobium sp.]|nr:type VI secretion system baseplate subunit TssE [Longimicrobium sp.]